MGTSKQKRPKNAAPRRKSELAKRPLPSDSVPKLGQKDSHKASVWRDQSVYLACPYRQRDPLKYNLREWASCSASHGFLSIENLMFHLALDHSTRRTRPDIYERYSKSGFSALDPQVEWTNIFKTLFPEDDQIPSAGFREPIENFEYHNFQETCVDWFAAHVQQSTDTTNTPSPALDSIRSTIKEFIDFTYQFANQHPLEILRDTQARLTEEFDSFAKQKAEEEDSKSFFKFKAPISGNAKGPGSSAPAHKCSASDVEPVLNVPVIKSEPDAEGAEMERPTIPPHVMANYDRPDHTISHPNNQLNSTPLPMMRSVCELCGCLLDRSSTDQQLVFPNPGGCSKCKAPANEIRSKSSRTAPVALNNDEIVSNSSSDVDTEEMPQDLTQRRKTRSVQVPDSVSTDGQGSDLGTEASEMISEAQVRQILNYSCHNILGTDLDLIASTPFLYDTLIDIAEVFVVDLVETAETHRGGSSSSNPNDIPKEGSLAANAPSNRTDTQRYLLGTNRNSDRDEQDENLEERERGRGFPGGFPNTIPGGKGKGLRLPCPLRMQYPRVFNVRSHYTCSMTYFPTIGRLKEHLREYHKRQDDVEFLCPRCYAGFKSRDHLTEHAREADRCEPAAFDPTVGLHKEAINLLRGRDKAGQDYLAQWRDICKIVFQTDKVVPSPKYRAVIEHFEFVETLLGSLDDGMNRIGLFISSEITKGFADRATQLFQSQFHLGLNAGTYQSLRWPFGSPTEHLPRELYGLHDHYIQKLLIMDQKSCDMPYENDGSRGNGSKLPRRRYRPRLGGDDGPPTPEVSQTTSATTPLQENSTPFVERSRDGAFQLGDAMQPSKRRRLAPAGMAVPALLAPASASSAQPMADAQPQELISTLYDWLDWNESHPYFTLRCE